MYSHSKKKNKLSEIVICSFTSIQLIFFKKIFTGAASVKQRSCVLLGEKYIKALLVLKLPLNWGYVNILY